ncbi:hypothetical protein TL16_g07665 [Triparma laevis f. inornata]|uniref:FAD-dependent oxidoreductase domain-containing protein 1 n=2 Tax=Triparma laevis TaxID=1534972 RepID=A0A9W7F4E3_9STRA|nr:hypothetical protein TL16_g07665 [Triparma laevis f. inornata]GMI03130.1 hypothetical protein TrLO_g2495 [Triparma laevis f. longispina]
MSALIIGSGILGSSISYHLTRSTGLLTTLIDAAQPSTCATSRSAGMILQSGSKEKIECAKGTISDIKELSKELSDDLSFKQTGTYKISWTPENVSQLKSDYETTKKSGVNIKYVPTELTRSEMPYLSIPSSSLITYTPLDGYIDPVILASSYILSARRAGLKTKFNTNVIRIGEEGEVELSTGEIEKYDHIIDATGIWAGMLGYDSLGLSPLHFSTVRSHYWITQPSIQFNKTVPNIILPDIGVYIRDYNGGIILGVQEENSLTWDRRLLNVDDESHGFLNSRESEGMKCLEERYEDIEKILPGISELEFKSYVPGWSSYTIDGKYILGEQGQNIYVASGCNGSGVSGAGGIGRIVKEGVMGGGWGEFDLRMFEGVEEDVFGEEFRNKCARARMKKFQAKE